jgi:hypothetical protein
MEKEEEKESSEENKIYIKLLFMNLYLLKYKLIKHKKNNPFL